MIVVILNPQSNSGKTIHLLPKIAKILQARDEPHYIYITTGPNDAINAARRFAPAARLMIAVGGDGTFNEVANGLLGTDVDIPLGLVPSGHGSDFARSIAMSTKLDLAMQQCLRGNQRRIDIGHLAFNDGTERYFLNIAGLGFDACVAERAQQLRIPGSTLPYLWGALDAMRSYRNLHFAINRDGELSACRAASVLVANGQFLAGGMKMVPMADLQDGLLDLAILGDLTRREMIREVPNTFQGKHISHPKFSHAHGRSIRVESIEPAQVQADGELIGYAPVTFTIKPGALLLAG